MVELVDHLFKNDSIQLAVFPEFVSFLSGRKKAMRIVYESKGNELDTTLFSKYGFHISNSVLWSRDFGNGFADLVPSPTTDKNDCGYTPINMTCISRSANLLDRLEAAEACGETIKAGRILGYPECCVEGLHSVTSRKELWGIYYLEDYRKSGFASRYVNRFPIVLGGMSSVGEIFPCSLSCPRAVLYSKNMIADMISFGYSRVAEKCLSHSSKSVRISELDGSISFSIEDSPSNIKFS
jgi:hypothetical protein